MAAMGAVTLALIGFFGFVIMRVTTPPMMTLFTDLSYEDSSAIIKDLERQNIPYEMKNDGAVIMVPKDKVTRLRMKLAEGGLPKGGGIGYEIFDKSDALGSTSFVQNINHLRALEGELARTIKGIDRIQAARVHLVLPERPLFSRETPEPSASIVLRVRGALEPQQVRAIRHIVASAVNGMKAQRVSIVDETGQLLANGASEDGTGDGAGGDDRRTAYEKRLRDQVEGIVSSVVGAGRARVQLSADFDYNKITQTSDKFDPEGRVLRSSQSREEASQTSDGKDGQVTVNNELPGNQGAEFGGFGERPEQEERGNQQLRDFPRHQDRSHRSQPRQSYLRRRAGRRQLHQERQGATWSTPLVRKKNSIASVRLVRSAIGFDQKRGDQVEVVNLRFAEGPSVIPSQEPKGFLGMFQFTKDDIMYFVELGVMMILGLVVVFMVVRPLLKRVLAADPSRKLLSRRW